jgi:nucleotide-binding universal stress UspA family protein
MLTMSEPASAHDGSSKARVLIAYDGSEPANHAIDQAGRLFPGMEGLVVTVWASVGHAAGAARIALSQAMINEAVARMDTEAEAQAAAMAQAGAARARAAGLDASTRVLPDNPSVASAILRAAENDDAAAVIVGSRGRSNVRSVLLGSVSNSLVHHCRRPVVVVHPQRSDEEPDVGYA